MMAEPDGEAFVCGTCFVVFESEEQLTVHSSTCIEEKPHVCAVCGEVFSEESEIIEHNETQHRTMYEETSDPDVGMKTEPNEEHAHVQDDRVNNSQDRQLEKEIVTRSENPKVLVIEPLPEDDSKPEIRYLQEEEGPEEGSSPTEPVQDRDVTTDIVAGVETYLNENRSKNGPASKFQVQVNPSTEESSDVQTRKAIVITVPKVSEETAEQTKQKTDQSRKRRRKGPYKVWSRSTTARDWRAQSEAPSDGTLRKCTLCNAWFFTVEKYHKHMVSQHTHVFYCKLFNKEFVQMSDLERHIEWHKRKRQAQQISKQGNVNEGSEEAPKLAHNVLSEMPKRVSAIQTPTMNSQLLGNTHIIQSPAVRSATIHMVQTPIVRNDIPETTRIARATTVETPGVPEGPTVVEYTMKLGSTQHRAPNSPFQVQDTLRLGQETSEAQNTMKSGDKVSEIQNTVKKESLVENAVKKESLMENNARLSKAQSTMIPCAPEAQNAVIAGGNTDICGDTYEKTGRCDICEGFFASKQRKHRSTKNQCGYTNRCDNCGRTFTAVRDYNRHVTTHNKDPSFIIKHALQPYSCPYCDKQLTSSQKLYKHLFTHSKGKLYQ